MAAPEPALSPDAANASGYDHSSNEEFYEYYAAESTSTATLERFRRLRQAICNIVFRDKAPESLKVADIGCGAGTLSREWAQAGHSVRSLDVNEPLLRLAGERAAKEGLQILFEVGTATSVPWPDECVDVCIAPELLEHVADWESCVNEFTRILKPGGLLFISTTNFLCPKQQEFQLPLYSWYPPALKRHYEKLSVTTRPELANHAKYPAVNWFTFYSLRRELKNRGFVEFLDRFDIATLRRDPGLKHLALSAIVSTPVTRLLAHIASEGTVIAAIKGGRAQE